MAQAFLEQLEQPPLQDLSFNERFALLVDRETLYRTNRRVANLLRQAKLRQQACVEAIDYQHPHNLNKSQFATFINYNFILQYHNLLITGPTGCGKSYLACAIDNQAYRHNLSARYFRVPRFFEELTIAHADDSYGKLLLQLLKVD